MGFILSTMTSDELLVVRSDWPAATIAGEPGIVSGILSLSADVMLDVLASGWHRW